MVRKGFQWDSNLPREMQRGSSLGMSGAVTAVSDTRTRAAEAGCIMKSFGKLLSYPEVLLRNDTHLLNTVLTAVSNSPSEQQWQQNLISLQFWPPSSFPFSVIPLTSHVWGRLIHPFIVYPQEERGAEFQLRFQFYLFIHFMTKLMTPMTKPRCTPISSTVRLFLSDCLSEDIFHTHLYCMILLACWLTCNDVKMPLCNS